MLGPFIDTIIICSMTGLVIIIGFHIFGHTIIEHIAQQSDADKNLMALLPQIKSSLDANNTIWFTFAKIFHQNINTASIAGSLQNFTTAAIFAKSLGNWSSWFVSGSLFFFSISTILGWYYYTDRCLLYLGANRFINIYRMIWVSFIMIGGITKKSSVVWSISNILNALMALPNLFALIALSHIIINETERYFPNQKLNTKLYLVLIQLLPKKTTSKIIGYLTRIKHPKYIVTKVIRAFAYIYSINIKEASLSLNQYQSLNQFFIRNLKEKSRKYRHTNKQYYFTCRWYYTKIW